MKQNLLTKAFTYYLLLVHMINKYKIYIRVHQSLKIKNMFCSMNLNTNRVRANKPL